MIIIGIDPGIHRMGFGVLSISRSGIVVLDQGLVSTPKNMEHPKRLSMLRSELNNLFGKYTPECVAVEKLFFQKNVKTAMKVGEARGVIMLAAAEHNLEVLEFTPNEVKVAITGYGNAEKAQVQKMITKLLGLSAAPKPDDVADALAIAYSGSLYHKSQKI